jgi:hypothetical protein
MRPRAGLVCKPSSWHGRQAFVLENDLIRLIALTGGGHIAEFRFREGSGPSTLNPLWIPPWKTIEPYLYREKAHTAAKTLAWRCACRQADSRTRTNEEGKQPRQFVVTAFRVYAHARRADLTHGRPKVHE